MTNRRTLELYELLPAYLRMRDHDQGYPLRALLKIIGEQAGAISDDISGLWDDFFALESSAEWVIPYIGELVDSGKLPLGARRRVAVAKAIHYRRRRGTVSMLEELAADVTGWGARVQSFAELVGWTQDVEHPRVPSISGTAIHDPYAGNAPGTVDLRDPNDLDRLDGPFDNMSHTVDVRSMGQSRGRYNLDGIGFYLWRLRSYPVRGATAFRASSPNEHGYHFSPLGNPMPLFTRPEPRTGDTDRIKEINVPGPIRGAFSRDLEEHRNYSGDATLERSSQASACYYGPDRSLHVVKDGDNPMSSEPVPPDDVVYQDLTTWERPRSGRMAVDVRLGRLTFAEGHEPGGEVRVDYNYGFSANLGGGTYYRRLPHLLDRAPVVPEYPIVLWEELEGYASFSTLTEALEHWRISESRFPAVIQIADSRTYRGVEISYAGGSGAAALGRELVIQAAHGQRPTLMGNLTVGGSSGRDRLTLHGLLISGSVEVQSSLESLDIGHCTLVPGRELDEEGRARWPEQPSLTVRPPDGPSRTGTGHVTRGLHLRVSRSIVGPLRLPSEASLEVVDSILDSPAGSDRAAIPVIDATEGGERPGPRTILKRATCFGRVNVRELSLATEVIFTERVDVSNTQTGQVRCSYVPERSQTPLRSLCQPEALAQNAELSPADEELLRTRLRPVFTSSRYGQPGYAQLDHGCHESIRTGAENGSEMGVFRHLGQYQREENLREILEEYLPLGLRAGFIYVT